MKNNFAFTLAEVLSPHSNDPHEDAFTLAEVLITLGIIGVIAALTIPSLIQSHNNLVVETRLKKFYSIMNQAVIMTEVEYGDKKDWYSDTSGTEIDSEGNPIAGTSLALNWYNQYLGKHIETTKIVVADNGIPTFYLKDGSAFRPATHTTRDWYFYIGSPEKCQKLPHSVGRCAFAFNFCPTSSAELWKFHYNKGFEPWKYNWSGTKEDLYNNAVYGCSATSAEPTFCTALIQYNNWTIPKDYPFKVKY